MGVIIMSGVEKFNESKFRSILVQFIGTEHYYKSIVPTLVYTDGIKYLAGKLGAYWLIDLAASYNTLKFRSKYRFQVWTIEVNKEDKSCIVYCREDTEDPRIVEQKIPYTDFPMDFEFFVVDGVMMLKTEY